MVNSIIKNQFNSNLSQAEHLLSAKSNLTDSHKEEGNLAQNIEDQNYLQSNLPEIIAKTTTLVEVLRLRSHYQPDQLAYTFLQDGETTEINLTYQELDCQARLIASLLQNQGLTGQRALLIYPPGLEFITAFFGCLYAGVTAVPAYPPRPNRSMERLEAIVDDAEATTVLTTHSVWQKLKSSLAKQEKLRTLNWLATDNIVTHLEAEWEYPYIDQDTLAFLQYTSGSTGNPKGVMVTHGNLIHNQKLIQDAFGHNQQSQGVIWLPPYHDMGLIGGIIQPLYQGFPVVLMSPMHFLQKPIRWLKAISRYQATTSGGPNFAYDLCLHKIQPEQLADLDLSSWQVAFNGAEPIKAETIEQFSSYFGECGFGSEAFYPCYGMAESTLFISGGNHRKVPVIKVVREAELENNQVVLANEESTGIRRLVSCGEAFSGTTVKIVNPETQTECQPQEVGEIWVAGDSVAQGYWNQPELTQKTFQAHTNNSKAGAFLRTGDLGFMLDGELYVTGRLKDVIIIRGRNHYPTDIESTVESSHEALAPNRSAAFTVEVNGSEKLVVVAEVERRYQKILHQSSINHNNIYSDLEDSSWNSCPNFPEITSNIKEAITKHHGLQAYAIVLLRIGTIPKTSSGKIRRYACRRDFLEGTLNIVGVDAPMQIKQKQSKTISLTAGIRHKQDKITA